MFEPPRLRVPGSQASLIKFVIVRESQADTSGIHLQALHLEEVMKLLVSISHLVRKSIEIATLSLACVLCKCSQSAARTASADTAGHKLHKSRNADFDVQFASCSLKQYG